MKGVITLEQTKVSIRPSVYAELKAFSEWSGVPMATVLTRLWLQSNARKEFLEKTEKKEY